MDTVEVSNLSRQFLYRKHHVGKYKADVNCANSYNVLFNWAKQGCSKRDE